MLVDFFNKILYRTPDHTLDWRCWQGKSGIGAFLLKEIDFLNVDNAKGVLRSSLSLSYVAKYKLSYSTLKAAFNKCFQYHLLSRFIH